MINKETILFPGDRIELTFQCIVHDVRLSDRDGYIIKCRVENNELNPIEFYDSFAINMDKAGHLVKKLGDGETENVAI